MGNPELGAFLRERRQRLDPLAAGVAVGGRRRTPGLRREEVAERAHISVDYYARLEQARGPRPSTQILEALSRALGMDPPERLLLFRLAGIRPTPPARPSRHVRPHVARLVQRMGDAAVIVTDATYDVVAWNPLAEILLGDLRGQPNLARRRFLQGRSWSSASDEFAEIAIARLRRSAARYPHDDRLGHLITELRENSPEFAHVWATVPARTSGHRVKTVQHPTVGEFEISCDVLAVPDDDQQVVFMTADPGSSGAHALQRLRQSIVEQPGAHGLQAR
ncbi:MAG: helix-turn-helix transcriptional regulator [Frankia sp.]